MSESETPTELHETAANTGGDAGETWADTQARLDAMRNDHEGDRSGTHPGTSEPRDPTVTAQRHLAEMRATLAESNPTEDD